LQLWNYDLTLTVLWYDLTVQDIFNSAICYDLWYDDMVSYVCTTRKIQEATFANFFDKGIFTLELNIYIICQNLERPSQIFMNFTLELNIYFEKGIFMTKLNIFTLELNMRIHTWSTIKYLRYTHTRHFNLLYIQADRACGTGFS
jgi:hypothetical protein